MALLLVSITISAGGDSLKSATTSAFDWNPVMDAIILVESEGNPNAVSGNSVGAMQITPILVKECNNILEKQKSNKRYTMADRYSVEKSKEMFLLIQKYFNPENNVEKAIRSWNGGVKYSVKATNRYYRKVLAKMK
ncbi:Transglycosylase SLT domain-containing protein [Xylanibacter ruminicola]|uniref:Transglycosylase SLT domain-containing protein n=2 Tax=Xylanibacter ruminicola TaxID=839 RepID=A0A1M6TVB1_XYLRU|nr:Transglycosylase SLT domain-containing protein [Xylanibacter ruminicola]